MDQLNAFDSDDQLEQYLLEHTDDMEEVVIPVPQSLWIGNRELKNAGALIKLCDGRQSFVSGSKLSD